MHCNACGQDRHPVIEGDQNGRFVYTCANAECHSVIGPVKPEGTKAPIAQAAPKAVQAAPVIVGDYSSQFRARLAELDAQLATMSALKAERATVARLLAAAERKPRAARTNVILMPAKVAK